MKNFGDKYTTKEEAVKPENKGKVVLSDDSFAVCEALEKLTIAIQSIKIK